MDTYLLSYLQLPYEHLIQPALPVILWAVCGILAFLMILDWIPPRRNPGRLSLLSGAALLVIIERWKFRYPAETAIWIFVCVGAILIVYLIEFRSANAGREFNEPAPWIAGFLVIAIATCVKCLDLGVWPEFIKAYAAQTGVDGLEALNGHWQQNLFTGKGFDLRCGGQSPLLLPFLWAFMKAITNKVVAIRATEIFGSTVLLTVVWFWLRRVAPGIWSIVTLSVFALSPWHLAQSRMGTFLSISAAVSMSILLAAQMTAEKRKTSWAAWLLLGAATGLIGYSYAPLKVLYPYFGICLVIHITRNIKTGMACVRGPIIACLSFGAIFFLQVHDLKNPGEMFKTNFGVLATDNPVWLKTVNDEVTTAIQPLPVISRNIVRNGRSLLALYLPAEKTLIWYPIMLFSGIILSLFLMIRHRVWVGPLYYLFGFLPSLLIFPLARRSFIIWPLASLIGVLFFREIYLAASEKFPGKLWRRTCGSFIFVSILMASLHGFHVLNKNNSFIGVNPHFGEIRKRDFIAEAEDLMSDHIIYFINPEIHENSVRVRLYERDKALGGKRYDILRTREEHLDFSQYKLGENGICYINVNPRRNQWVRQQLISTYPECRWIDRMDPLREDNVLYTVYFCSR